MPKVHLTKVAYSCASVETLERRIARWSEAGEIRVPTRMRPKRAAECVGGYLHYDPARTTLTGSVGSLWFRKTKGNWLYDLQYAWDGDHIAFQRPGVSGSLHVGKTDVRLDVELSFLLTPLKGPIENAIQKEFDALFKKA